MTQNALHPRFITPRLAEALEDSPVVLIQGPRQSGKTTLAQMMCAPANLQGLDAAAGPAYGYLSFDDDVVRAGAEADPMAFVDRLPDRVVLDEVQRAPGLFTALKLEVDRRRTPGRFLLTGSTNVLAVPTVQESLAGRLETIHLHPLSQSELHTGAPAAPSFLDALFTDGPRARRTARLGPKLADLIVSGGYPPALARPPGRRRANWYRNYISAQMQRDVADVSRIRGLDVLPRLLALAATQTAQLFNVSSLAAPFQLSRPTIGDYVTLLERAYLLERLPPWYSNRGKRLVKTPKLHVGDTGVVCSLLGVSAQALLDDRTLLGQVAETFVFQELRRQAGWHADPVEFYHYRDKDQYEVDVVMECAGRVAGVEVKAGATVTQSDFRGLRRLKEACAERFAAGAVLYDGEAVVGFGESLFAVPMQTLWEGE
ncbi:MAG: ATP-binding protein [Chloroflexi bacterium]|nr:ATP-binding protein [Chloroflexota bacterium]